MGQIILAYLNNKLQLAELIEVTDHANKIRIKTGRNKEQKTHKKNQIYITNICVKNPKDFVDFSNKVAETIEKIDLKKAWEHLINQDFSSISVEHILKALDLPIDSHEFKVSVFLSMNNDDTYFQFKPNQIQMISKTEVLKKIKIMDQRKIADEKKTRLAKILLNGNFHKQLKKDDLEIIDNLKSIVLYGDKKIKKTEIFEFCEKFLNTTQRSDIFELLVKNKILDKNLPVELYQAEIPIRFSPKIHKITESITTQNSDDYEDLTNLETYTIDDESTKDRDDAFSFQQNFLWIHITDLTNLFDKNSEIDLEAFNRSRSIYLPEFTIPMLPPKISQEVGSINPNQPQKCISLQLEINAQTRFLYKPKWLRMKTYK